MSYYGRFSDDITNNVIDVIVPLVESEPALRKKLKKVPFLIAECYQNIVRHAIRLDELYNPEGHAPDNIQIAIDNREINITTINTIPNDKIPLIEASIDEVNNLNADELRELKNRKMDEDEFSSKGGAGLGLIEMARKTGQPIRKRFVRQSNYHSIFIMTIDIVFDEEQVKASIPQVTFETLYFEQLHAEILLAYKGDMREVCTNELKQIIDKQFRINGQVDVEHEDWIIVMNEMLANANKHGKQINTTIPGFIGIQVRPFEKSVSCGNFIDFEEVPTIEEYITKIKDLSKKEIRQILKNPEFDYSRFKGKGLLDIISKAKGPLRFEFVENYFEHMYFLNSVRLV